MNTGVASALAHIMLVNHSGMGNESNTGGRVMEATATVTVTETPTITQPDLPCQVCKKPNAVYNPTDLCSRCQRRVEFAMGRISLVDKGRAGWRRMTDRGGNFAGYQRAAQYGSAS